VFSRFPTRERHPGAARVRLNRAPPPPGRFKWTRPFRRKKNVVSSRVPSHFKRTLP